MKSYFSRILTSKIKAKKPIRQKIDVLSIMHQSFMLLLLSCMHYQESQLIYNSKLKTKNS